MRKFRATEISGTVNINQNGSHVHANWFCLNCHCIGNYEQHYPDCTKPEAYTIPASAEVPRRNANKRTWSIFIKQFVTAKPNGWWMWEEHSWWHKHKEKSK